MQDLSLSCARSVSGSLYEDPSTYDGFLALAMQNFKMKFMFENVHERLVKRRLQNCDLWPLTLCCICFLFSTFYRKFKFGSSSFQLVYRGTWGI